MPFHFFLILSPSFGNLPEFIDGQKTNEATWRVKGGTAYSISIFGAGDLEVEHHHRSSSSSSSSPFSSWRSSLWSSSFRKTGHANISGKHVRHYIDIHNSLCQFPSIPTPQGGHPREIVPYKPHGHQGGVVATFLWKAKGFSMIIES